LDYSGFLFTDAGMITDECAREHSLLSLNMQRNLGFNPEVATASAQELEHFTDQYPESTLALGQLATIYRYQHQLDKAAQTLQRIPMDKWNYLVEIEMGRIQAAQGNCRVAEQHFLKALDQRDEKVFSRAVLDLAVLYAVCLKDTARAEHYLNRYNSFVLSPAEREQVRQLAAELGIKLSE
jgi:tetratricopeptide (TPR) repeat protein